MSNAHHLESGVQSGDVLAGKYRVERVLGAGGMGVVVAAHHMQLDTRVAIKFLRPDMLSDGEAVARFAREAKAAVKITSEHVARINDVGTLETGAPYMVMEYLEGGDLATWLDRRGPLPIEQAVEFVLQACVAVAEAHSLGIVHRDLKPANLFCIRRPDGQLSIKVLDFGISKLIDIGSTRMSMTKTSEVMGSPHYMSPEQMQSNKRTNAQSDIWGLGVILYELIGGRVPFEGDAATEIAVRVAVDPPRSLRDLRPEVPPGLEAIILKCLEKAPRHRYRNVAELAVSLAEYGTGRAKGYVERIKDTVHTSGLSASALAKPPSFRPLVAVASKNKFASTVALVRRVLPFAFTWPRGGREIAVAVGVAIATILVAGASWRLLVPSRAAYPAASTAQTSPAVPIAAKPPAQPEAKAALVQGTVPAVVDIASLPVARPTARPTGAATAAGSRDPAATPASRVTAPNCNPPFFFDSVGHKQYKPACM